MDKNKIIYIGILLIVTVLISVTYFSYAFFTSRIEQHGKLNIVAGTLNYQIESNDLVNNSIVLESNESKTINIKITSLNDIKSKYELYYTTTNDNIRIGYSNDNDLPVDTIDKNASKDIVITIKNNSDSSTTVTFGVEGGFIDNNLVLSLGNSITEIINISSCDYATGYVWNFDYTGNSQEFILPCDGNYKLEVWGAQGATKDSYIGGFGAYAAGNIDATKGTNLYIYVGELGQNKSVSASYGSLGFNGASGGNYTCYEYHNHNDAYNYYGGGATDIRLVDGNWKNIESLKSRIIVASGGSSGTPYGNGSAGGGLNGYSGTSGNGATQISAGGPSYGGFGYAGVPAKNTVCSSSDAYGAGSGYYGGGATNLEQSNMGSNQRGPAGSGSSFISGHTGCDAIDKSSTESNIIHTGQPNHYSGYVFTNTQMIDGAGCKWTNQLTSDCSGQPQPDGAITTGHAGNGYARITYIGD